LATGVIGKRSDKTVFRLGRLPPRAGSRVGTGGAPERPVDSDRHERVAIHRIQRLTRHA
jgi:hypothetical protein